MKLILAIGLLITLLSGCVSRQQLDDLASDVRPASSSERRQIVNKIAVSKDRSTVPQYFLISGVLDIRKYINKNSPDNRVICVAFGPVKGKFLGLTGSLLETRAFPFDDAGKLTGVSSVVVAKPFCNNSKLRYKLFSEMNSKASVDSSKFPSVLKQGRSVSILTVRR